MNISFSLVQCNFNSPGSGVARNTYTSEARFASSRRDSNYRGRLVQDGPYYKSVTGGVTFNRKVGKKLADGREVLLSEITVRPLVADPTQVEITYTQRSKYLNNASNKPEQLGLKKPITIVGKPGSFRLTDGVFEKHSVDELAKGLLKAALNPPKDPAMQGKNQPKKPKPQVGAPKASGAPKKPSGGGYSGGSGGIRSRSRRRGF